MVGMSVYRQDFGLIFGAGLLFGAQIKHFDLFDGDPRTVRLTTRAPHIRILFAAKSHHTSHQATHTHTISHKACNPLSVLR